MTHRQHRALRAWLDLQWNRPSRTDHYLMAVEAAVIRFAGRTAADPDSVRPTPIRFVERDEGNGDDPGETHLLPGGHPGRLPEDREPTEEEVARYTQWSKACWFTATGHARPGGGLPQAQQE